MICGLMIYQNSLHSELGNTVNATPVHTGLMDDTAPTITISSATA